MDWDPPAEGQSNLARLTVSEFDGDDQQVTWPRHLTAVRTVRPAPALPACVQ